MTIAFSFKGKKPSCVTEKCLFCVQIFLICFVQLSFGRVKLDISTPDAETVKFDVKPGGQVNEYTQERDGFVCIFKYACQGGTKEEWEMSLQRNDNGKHYKCIVSRPGGRSYLFFQEFSLEVKGVKLMSSVLYANNDKLVEFNEYNIDRENNIVTHVPGEFKSELTLVGIYAHPLKIKKKKKKKQEL